MTSWRTANNHRRRSDRRKVKQARFDRLQPWQRLLAVFENMSRSFSSATLHMRRLSYVLGKSRLNTMDPEALDALRYGVPTRITIP